MDAHAHGWWTKNVHRMNLNSLKYSPLIPIVFKPKYAYALEMRQNGEGCDCRIEVSQKDGDDLHEKVCFLAYRKYESGQKT
jgi:hypothetical protein